jgi:hypothetical protein
LPSGLVVFGSSSVFAGVPSAPGLPDIILRDVIISE